MEYTLTLGSISATVSSIGAELISFTDGEREYIWQGHPSGWTGKNPNLFPVIGRVKPEGILYSGKAFPMPKHGFLRDVEFTADILSEDYLVLVYAPDEGVKACYPFDFEFFAKFALESDSLVFAYEVENKDAETMYFSLGAHPGFNISFGDKVVFDTPESLTALYYNEADRPNPDAAPVVMSESDTLEITKEFFDLYLKELIENNKKLLEEAEKYYQQDRKDLLSNYAVELDSTGRISNYEEIQQWYIDQLNKHADNETQYTKIEEQYEKFKDAASKYEESLNKVEEYDFKKAVTKENISTVTRGE